MTTKDKTSLNQNAKRRNTLAWIIFFLVIIILVTTAPDIGLTWDEPAYIVASESYLDWFELLVTQPIEAFSPNQIDAYWEPNHEHPPLDKVWSGFIRGISRFIFDDLVAHRLGNMLLVAIMAALLYFWIAESVGDLAGLGATAALLAMPRFFFHAHLAALDVPIAFMVFLVTFLFWKKLEERSWKSTLLLGIIWGATLATKVNAFFILPTLLLWVLIFRRKGYHIARLIMMGVIGIPFSVLLWPWVYHDTFNRLFEYIKFITVDHWEIGIWYLGEFHMPPPWHYAFVIAWAVIPLGILLIALFGAAISIKNAKQDQGLGWLLFLSALVPLAALSTGKSMVYDGERLFMPAFPFFAALAGIGISRLDKSIQSLFEKKNFSMNKELRRALLTILIFATPIVTSAQLYPHLLSYYSYGVGGNWCCKNGLGDYLT